MNTEIHVPISTDIIRHCYSFDPSHGYDLEKLLRVSSPESPVDFENFWKYRYARALAQKTDSQLSDTGKIRGGWRIFDWSYLSTDEVRVAGWVLLPVSGGVRRGFVISHGYGGREQPDFDLPFEEAVLFFPCARGLGRSRMASISSDSQDHVLHGIESKETYVLGGCIDDLWLAVSAALHHFPEIAGHLGYLGLSFGGGIGVMMLAWDHRIQRAHFNVPTFGNHPLRITLESIGSAASVQRAVKKQPEILQTLSYYDAAVAARYIRVPVYCACALFDPMVAPAGQFAIYNAMTAPKELFVLDAGHHAYRGQGAQEIELRQNLNNFFRDL